MSYILVQIFIIMVWVMGVIGTSQVNVQPSVFFGICVLLSFIGMIIFGCKIHQLWFKTNKE